VNIARLSGTSTTTFQSCVFSGWDAYKTGAFAIEAIAGSLVVNVRGREGEEVEENKIPDFSYLPPQSCTFQDPKNQILLAPNVNKAIITGNLFTGTEKITNQAVR
jgi:hypothetical protein